MVEQSSSRANRREADNHGDGRRNDGGDLARKYKSKHHHEHPDEHFLTVPELRAGLRFLVAVEAGEEGEEVSGGGHGDAVPLGAVHVHDPGEDEENGAKGRDARDPPATAAHLVVHRRLAILLLLRQQRLIRQCHRQCTSSSASRGNLARALRFIAGDTHGRGLAEPDGKLRSKSMELKFLGSFVCHLHGGRVLEAIDVYFII